MEETSELNAPQQTQTTRTSLVPSPHMTLDRETRWTHSNNPKHHTGCYLITINFWGQNVIMWLQVMSVKDLSMSWP